MPPESATGPKTGEWQQGQVAFRPATGHRCAGRGCSFGGPVPGSRPATPGTARSLLAGRPAGLGAVSASLRRAERPETALWMAVAAAPGSWRRRAGRIGALEGLPSLPATAFRASAPFPAATWRPLTGPEDSNRARSGLGSGDSGPFRPIPGASGADQVLLMLHRWPVPVCEGSCRRVVEPMCVLEGRSGAPPTPSRGCGGVDGVVEGWLGRWWAARGGSGGWRGTGAPEPEGRRAGRRRSWPGGGGVGVGGG